MIRVTVAFSAQIRTATDAASQTLELEEGSTVGMVVRRLAATYGEEFRRLVMHDPETRRPSTLVFVGDEQVRDDGHALRDGDELFLTTPIAGG